MEEVQNGEGGGVSVPVQQETLLTSSQLTTW